MHAPPNVLNHLVQSAKSSKHSDLEGHIIFLFRATKDRVLPYTNCSFSFVFFLKETTDVNVLRGKSATVQRVDYDRNGRLCVNV